MQKPHRKSQQSSFDKIYTYYAYSIKNKYNSNVIGTYNIVEHSKTKNRSEAVEDYQNTCRSGKLFDCDICNKRFEDIDCLKVHLRGHVSGKRYICDVCQRGFTRMSHLERHLLTHTGEKPFICNVCQKRFRQYPHLTRHQQIHWR